MMAVLTPKPYPGVGPWHVGEWCLNHSKEVVRAVGVPARRDEYNWLEDKRLGRPRPDKGKTIEQLEAVGVVGLYIAWSRGVPEGYTEVDTPPELMEPGKEALYNVNGPGLTGKEGKPDG